MRLDAGKGAKGWNVWHAEECRNIGYECRWVDDETHQYGRMRMPRVIIHNRIWCDTIQARRIVILPSRRLVIINPVDDDDEIETEFTETVNAAA